MRQDRNISRKFLLKRDQISRIKSEWELDLGCYTHNLNTQERVVLIALWFTVCTESSSANKNYF